MRIDPDTGEPLAHLLPDPDSARKEAQMGLDELLKKAHLLQDREKRNKAAQKLLDDSEEMAAKRIAKANALAARFEWLPVKSVTLFLRQTCRNCGCVNHIFQGYGTLLRQKSSSAHVIRTTGCLDQGLPHEMRLLEETADICYDCVEEVAEPEPPEPYKFHPEGRPDA